jgi:O-antigen/teichoic acid export membrane protein
VAVDIPAAEVDAQPAAPVRGLASATFEATAFRFGILPLSFATTIITSRYLLPEGRGAFVLALLTVTLVWTLLSSVMVGITKEIGYHRRDASAMLVQGMVLSLALGFVGAAVLVPSDLLTAGQAERVVALAALALPAMLVTAAIGGALTPLGRFREWNVLQVLPQLFVVCGMLLLVVVLGRRLTGAVVSWVVAQILVAAIALYASRDIWAPALRGRRWLTPNRMRPMLKLGLALGVVNLVGVLNYRVELFVIQAFDGLDSVGIYSVAASFAELAWLPVTALAMVSTPAIVNTQTPQAIDAVARGVRHTLVLTVGLGAAIGVIGFALIPLLVGTRYEDARVPLLILVPAIVVFAPAKIVAVYLSSRLGRPGFQLAVAMVSTALTAVAALLLVPPLGINGAALATLIGYSGGMGLELALLARFSIPLGTLLPGRTDLRAYRTPLEHAARWTRRRRDA